MKDRIFCDTNIIIYLYSDDEHDKRQICRNLTDAHDITVSTQVLSELASVLKKKFNLPSKEIYNIIDELRSNLDVKIITVSIILTALKLSQKYNLSYYDSLIISSALDSECDILYTEDLQHNQIIEKKLKIINPFKQ